MYSMGGKTKRNPFNQRKRTFDKTNLGRGGFAWKYVYLAMFAVVLGSF